MASPPYAASMKVLSHSERQPPRGTGRTKDVPGFDRLTGSLAFISNLSMRAGSAREPVTSELSGPTGTIPWSSGGAAVSPRPCNCPVHPERSKHTQPKGTCEMSANEMTANWNWLEGLHHQVEEPSEPMAVPVF